MTARLNRRALLHSVAAVGGVGALWALSGCQGAPEVVPSDDHAEDIGAVVLVGDNFYEPTQVTIKAGQAVRWEWVGRDRHDVVANNRQFVSELMPEGEYIHIFEEPGDFSYVCSIHPEMRGMVTVK